MTETFPIQAISEIADPDKIRVVIFINGEFVHAPLAAILSAGDSTGSSVYDPASLADGHGVTTTFSVAGAALGAFVDVSFSLDLQGVSITAWVSATDTVSVRFQNETGAPVDLSSGTIKVRARS